MTSITKLQGVHPRLVVAVHRILLSMGDLGFPMTVWSGVRTTAQQVALFEQGRTKPGKIVTYLDGVQKTSNHQVKADGLGYAVDMVFLVNGRPSWDDAHPWALYGAMAKALGLTWGGEWKMRDLAHIELPTEGGAV